MCIALFFDKLKSKITLKHVRKITSSSLVQYQSTLGT